MNFNPVLASAVQMPVANMTIGDLMVDPGALREIPQLSEILTNDPDLRKSYEAGRQIFARMLKLPREEQIQKLRDLQQIVLQERRNRLKNAKSGFTHAQLVEAGKARLLHIAYHKRGKLPGDELALQWLQTSWLEAKDDLEAAEKMFLYERRRLEVHRREILPQFEARALQIFGLIPGDDAKNQGQPRGIVNTLPTAQNGPLAQFANPLVSNGAPQQMGQMAPPANHANPFLSNGTPQQTGQLAPSANPMSSFVSNVAPQQMGQLAPPVSPANILGPTTFNPPMGQATPSSSQGNFFMPSSMSLFDSIQQIAQMEPQGNLTNPFGPSSVSQHVDQMQPQGYLPSEFGSNAFLQQMGQTVQPGGFNPFLDNIQPQQMEMLAAINPANNSSHQPEYPNGNTSTPRSNNSLFSARPQIPGMAPRESIEWLIPIQESVNNPSIPAHVDVFGMGVDWALGAPDFGPQINRSTAVPAMSSSSQGLEGPFNTEMFLDNAIADPGAQNGGLVFRETLDEEATTTECEEMKAILAEVIGKMKEDGDESSEEYDDEEDAPHENFDGVM